MKRFAVLGSLLALTVGLSMSHMTMFAANGPPLRADMCHKGQVINIPEHAINHHMARHSDDCEQGNFEDHGDGTCTCD